MQNLELSTHPEPGRLERWTLYVVGHSSQVDSRIPGVPQALEQKKKAAGVSPIPHKPSPSKGLLSVFLT